jgi:hypothetical protein
MKEKVVIGKQCAKIGANFQKHPFIQKCLRTTFAKAACGFLSPRRKKNIKPS